MKAIKKRIIAVLVVCILFLIFGFLLYPRDKDQSEYIFDKKYNIRLTDVNKSRSALPRRQASENLVPLNQAGEAASETDPAFDIKAIFSEGLINAHTTLKYFKHLEHQFRKTATLEEHFKQVREYLFSHFPENEAKILFGTYQKYLECEMALGDEYKNFTGAGSPEEAIAILRRIQDFRRERLGQELADQLFGTDVKAKEYAFRRAAIVADDSLYGKDKEDRIRELNADMWGEEAAAVEEHPNPYNRYQEKLEVYTKDLEDLASDAARQEKIKEFRKEFFPPETVEKLEAIDSQVVEEQVREENYQAAAKQVREDSNLSDRQKEERIRQLQDRTFGEEADALRRREAMEKGREEFIQQKQQKPAGATE